MKKTMIALFGALAIMASMFAVPQAANATQHVSIYFSPHQDDETLSMGNAISRDLSLGSEVYVVLFTDGGGTGAKGLMCDPDRAGNYSQWPTVCTDPYTGTDSNTTKQVSRSNMTRYRLNEFYAALEAMGVAHDHICSPGPYVGGAIALNLASLPCGDDAIKEQLFLDGQTTRTQADAVVNGWHSAFPTASLNTISWMDVSPDHYNLGYALKSLCQNYGSCSWWQSNQYHGSVPTPSPSSIAYQTTRMNAANAAYHLRDPSQARAAVGPVWSVPSEFATLPGRSSWGHGRITSTNFSQLSIQLMNDWLSHCQDGTVESSCYNPNL